MMSRYRLFLAGTLVLLLVGDAVAQKGKRGQQKYEDADLGLAFVLQGEWTRVPHNPDVPWTAARFSSDPTPKMLVQAHVRVVVLPQDVDKARSFLAVDPTDPYSIRPGNDGFATYRAFVEATTGSPYATRKEFAVQEVGKGMSPVGPYLDFEVREGRGGWFLRRARVFERAGMHVVVEASMESANEDELKKLWKEITGSIRPVSTRNGPAPSVEKWLSRRLLPEDYAAWRALPAATRHELRTRAEKLWFDAIREHTTKAWRCEESKRFLVLSTYDVSADGYVEKLEAFASYLDGVLGPLSDDRPRRLSVRICTNDERWGVFTSWPDPRVGLVEVALPVRGGRLHPEEYGR